MPAKHLEINLLQQKGLQHSPVGRIIQWATTYGRYIMIGTEIVVLLAFISRFSLDRKLADLNEEINEKQTIIEVNQDLENRIRKLQDQLSKIKTLTVDQDQSLQTILLIQKLLPADVYLETFDYLKTQYKLTAVAGTTNGFASFITNLVSSNKFVQVELGEVKKEAQSGIKFQANLVLKTEKKISKK